MNTVIEVAFWIVVAFVAAVIPIAVILLAEQAIRLRRWKRRRAAQVAATEPGTRDLASEQAALMDRLWMKGPEQ